MYQNQKPSGIIIRACPECGKDALVNCWHDETVHSVDMPIEKALDLLLDYTNEQREKYFECNMKIADYRNRLAENLRRAKKDMKPDNMVHACPDCGIETLPLSHHCPECEHIIIDDMPIEEALKLAENMKQVYEDKYVKYKQQTDWYYERIHRDREK